MRKKPSLKTDAPVGPAMGSSHAGCSICAGCQVRQETIEFLRDQLRQAQLQNDQLQNKLLSLVGDAADRYQRLRVMECASNAPANHGGMMMIGNANDNEGGFDDGIDAFVDSIHAAVEGGNAPAPRKR